MKTTLLTVFTLIITLSTIKSQALEFDFEGYEVGKNVNSIHTVFTNAPNILKITDTESASGKNSVLLITEGSSMFSLLNYPDKDASIIEIEFKIKKLKNEQLTIGLNGIFPFITLRPDDAVSTYLSYIETGPVLLDNNNDWVKVKYKIHKNINLFEVYINDSLLGLGENNLWNTLSTLNINLYGASKAFIDDIKYAAYHTVALDNDISLFNINSKTVSLTGGKSNQVITVINKGLNEINAVEVIKTYGNKEEKELIENISLKTNEKLNITLEKFTHEEGKHPVKFEVKIWNMIDEAPEDNIATLNIHGFTPKNKKLLFEYITGTWCGYCPANIVGERKLMNEIGREYYNSVYVHADDVMEVEDYRFNNVTSVPSLLINRQLKESVYHDNYNIVKSLSEASPVYVEAKVKLSDGKLYGESEIYFDEYYDDYIYHSFVIAEDSVNGNTNYYNQANFYSGDTLSGMEEFIDLPFTIPASQMYYKNVGRYIVNGLYGKKSPISFFEKDIKYSLETELPLTINKLNDRHYIYSIILDKNRRIINTDRKRIKDVLYTINDVEDQEFSAFSIFPNPTTDFINISNLNSNCDIKLFNINGQLILKTKDDIIDMRNHPNGIYFIEISDEEKVQSLKFLKH